MSAPAGAPYLLWLVLEGELTILNRIVGMLRRHRLTLGGLATMPGPAPGLMTMTAMVRAEPASLDIALSQLRKTVGVRAGAVVPLAAVVPEPSSLPAVEPSATQEIDR